MNIHTHSGTIKGMDISLLNNMNDIEQLRTLALAMVQNVVSENAKKEEKLLRQNTALQQRILLLEEMLKLARQQRFGKCPDCQGTLHHIRDEVSEKLEYIPARVVVNRYVRPQYSCTCCQRVVSGDMPAHIIPKGVAEPHHHCLWSPGC